MYIKAMLILIILIDIHTKYVDFFLSYTQADIKSEIFMELPIIFGVGGANQNNGSSERIKNLYGLNNAGLVWFKIFKEGLEVIGFLQ